MKTISMFIERHPHTMNFIMWLVTSSVLWFGGLSAFFKRFRAKPKLEVQESASWVYIKRFSVLHNNEDVVIAAFVPYVILINASNEKIALRKFSVSFQNLNEKTKGVKLSRIPFPSTPVQIIGEMKRAENVWYTHSHGDDLSNIAPSPALGVLDPQSKDTGYCLFVSCTHGNYNPEIIDGFIHGMVIAELISGKKLKCKFKLRVTHNEEEMESFCKGFCAHVENVDAWKGMEEL